jgi:hypothetical protein
MRDRYEITQLDEHDPDAVESWTRRYCSATPLGLIREQYGDVEDRAELARQIARTFPSASRQAAHRGACTGFGLPAGSQLRGS